MKKKACFALLNINNFGINLTKNQANNLYKWVPFDNFKKLINIFQVAEVFDYAASNDGFEKELYQAFNFSKTQSYHLGASLRVNLENLFAQLKTAQKLNIKAIQVIINVNNDFTEAQYPVIEAFLLALQYRIFKNNKVRFYFDLLVDKPIYNWSFLQRAVNVIVNNNYKRFFMIRSICDRTKINGIFANKNDLNNYYQSAFKKNQIYPIYSLKNLMHQIEWENEINGVFFMYKFLNENNKNLPKSEATIFFDFGVNTFSNLKTLVEQNDPNLFCFQTKIVAGNNFYNKTDINNKSNLIVVIDQNKELNPISALVKKQINVNTSVQYLKNPYTYLFNLAASYYQALEKALFNGEVILWNWNILTEAKKYFNPDLWLYSLILFNHYILKTMKLLEKFNVKWTLFSTGYGFEKNFQIDLKDRIRLLYLTNGPVEHDSVFFKPKPKGINFLAQSINKCLNYVPINLIKKTDKTILHFSQITLEKETSINSIQNINDLVSYLNKFSLAKNQSKITVASILELKIKKTFKINQPFDFKQWAYVVDRIKLNNPFINIYFEEKKLIQSLNLEMSDLLYFYKRIYDFKNANKNIYINYKELYNFDNMFINVYLRHIEMCCKKMGLYTRKMKQKKAQIYINLHQFYNLNCNLKVFYDLFQVLEKNINNIGKLKIQQLESNTRNYLNSLESDENYKMQQTLKLKKWHELFLAWQNQIENKINQEFNLLRVNSDLYEYNDIFYQNKLTIPKIDQSNSNQTFNQKNLK